MQFAISKVGWVLYVVLGTTACESLHAATTLFLGMVNKKIIKIHIIELKIYVRNELNQYCFVLTEFAARVISDYRTIY